MSRIPEWKPAAQITRVAPERGKTNLSRLSPPAKRRAFEQLQQHEPGIAEFITRMHDRFGRGELLIDDETADRLGIGRDD